MNNQTALVESQGRRLCLTTGIGALALAAGGARAIASPQSDQVGSSSPSASVFLLAARPQVEEVQMVFADLVPELVASSETVSPTSLSSSAGVLATAASKLGIPMTFCVVPVGGKAGRVIPEFADYANEGNTFSRIFTNPFMDASFVQRLKDNARPTLIVSGFTVETVVLLTALDALAAGYKVHVPVDAVGSRSARTEPAAIRQIELAGGVVTSVRSLLMRLAPNISKGRDAEVFKALSGQK
ncbi:isochorismatase family protein [Ralstonia solanacearum]|uniref:isochorismatase family protein n=1 Tax=Ralstonia solanacearum TaxID=305 RepID=UPI000697C967|nr:isochorismatase family protein [Ralstonia solanacearum]